MSMQFLSLLTHILLLKFVYCESIANLMSDVLNRTAPSNFQDSSASNNFYTRASRLSVQANSFSQAGVKVWNVIPTTLRHLSKIAFKRKLKQSLFNILGSQDS